MVTHRKLYYESQSLFIYVYSQAIPIFLKMTVRLQVLQVIQQMTNIS
jgi:hypothetical protein